MATNILKNAILLGQVVPSNLKQAIKVRVPHYEWNAYFKAYFKNETDFVVHDPSKECQTGDTVIIKTLEKQWKKDITHQVQERLYKLGDMQDPVSGQMVVTNRYRERQKEMAKIYGENEDGFDYDKAPARGVQAGIRDFSDKPTYRRWHKFDEVDPYSRVGSGPAPPYDPNAERKRLMIERSQARFPVKKKTTFNLD